MGKLEKIDKLQKMKESGALTEEEFNNTKNKLLNDEKSEDKKIGDIKFWIFSGVVIGISLIIIIIVGGERSYKENKYTNSSSLETKSVINSEDSNVKSNTSNNNNYNLQNRTQSTILYQETKPKTKVYSATVLNGAKIHEVNSKTGFVSYSRYCPYCGNEWAKSTFSISNTGLYEVSSGYCFKCKNFVGNVKIQCTVVEQ